MLSAQKTDQFICLSSVREAEQRPEVHAYILKKNFFKKPIYYLFTSYKVLTMMQIGKSGKMPLTKCNYHICMRQLNGNKQEGKHLKILKNKQTNKKP